MDKDMELEKEQIKDNLSPESGFIPIQVLTKKSNPQDEFFKFADQIIELNWKENYFKRKKN